MYRSINGDDKKLLTELGRECAVVAFALLSALLLKAGFILKGGKK